MATAAIPASSNPFVNQTERPYSTVVPLPFKIARFLLLSMLMVAPMAFGAVQTWAWASLAVIAAVLLILWAVGCIQQGTAAIHCGPLYAPAALILLLGIVQLTGHLTLDPFGTREALIELSSDLIFFFLAGQFWADASEKVRKSFGLAVAIYAVLMTLFGIVQFFSSHGLLYWSIHTQGNVFGPYVNHNDYAGLMEMLIPVTLCYALSQPLRSPLRPLFLLGVCSAVASVLLSGSRSGMISVLVEMAVLGVLLWRLKEVHFVGKRKPLGLMGAAGAAALFLVLTPASAWRHMETIAGVASKPEVTLEDRLVVSHDALKALKAYPWLGTGLGSFEPVFPQFQSFPTDLVWNHAHDDYVEGLMETGAVGGLLILAALLLFFSQWFSNLHERLKHTGGWIELGTALGCCGLLVHSLADFNLHIPANAAWFAVSAALSVAPAMKLRLRLR